MRDIYTRPRGPLESTDFSLTRFLVPYLCGYEGHAVFMDCDMLCLTDITRLWEEIEAQYFRIAWVCQHPTYTPKDDVKFLGQPQTAYPMKNWSSFMVFNNAWCRTLTPDYVNTATGLQLHQFHWLSREALKTITPPGTHHVMDKPGRPTGTEPFPGTLGTLDLSWNWLVGEYATNPDAKILHYTLGGPWFSATAHCDQAEAWYDERTALLAAAPLVMA